MARLGELDVIAKIRISLVAVLARPDRRWIKVVSAFPHGPVVVLGNVMCISSMRVRTKPAPAPTNGAKGPSFGKPRPGRSRRARQPGPLPGRCGPRRGPCSARQGRVSCARPAMPIRPRPPSSRSRPARHRERQHLLYAGADQARAGPDERRQGTELRQAETRQVDIACEHR